MHYQLVLSCDDFTAAGVKLNCCVHCHHKRLSPTWPPTKRGGLDMSSKVIAAVCCRGSDLSMVKRGTWARVARLARKNKRSTHREVLLGSIEEELQEIVG